MRTRPVALSATAGAAPVVAEGVTGALLDPLDTGSIAAALARAAALEPGAAAEAAAARSRASARWRGSPGCSRRSRAAEVS